jgi:hypothetical protein
VVFAYVFLDPANLPSEVMLQWNDGTWEHRAFWGDNSILYGNSGSSSRRYMGALPSAGQWIRLEVPASQVGLEGSTLRGMAFSVFNGQATWDAAGKGKPLAVTITSGTNTTTVDTNAPTVATNNPTVDTNPPTVGTNNVSTDVDEKDPVVSTNNPSVDSNPPTVVTNTPTVQTNTAVTDPPTVVTNAPNDSTNQPPGSGVGSTFNASVLDYTGLEMPRPGNNTLHILSPTLLELELINTKQPDPARVNQWDFVNNGQLAAPSASQFQVTVGGRTVAVQGVGFKRRPLYAPLVKRDLRIDNCLYLQLNSPIADNEAVEVKNPGGALWASSMIFSNTANALRYSPAIHVNQEGYMPNYPKKAMVGYYLGNLGEMDIAASLGFKLVDAATGAEVFQGSLVARTDVGYNATPAPYRKVLMADFSSFNTPGEYRLVVPGLGASLPFLIDSGIAMDFARTYALGLYHQRCGSDNKLPFHAAHAQCLPHRTGRCAYARFVLRLYLDDHRQQDRRLRR